MNSITADVSYLKWHTVSTQDIKTLQTSFLVFEYEPGQILSLTLGKERIHVYESRCEQHF
jgi:hypothetical protein